MNLENKWKHTFSYLAQTETESYKISHWTKNGLELRKKIIKPLINKFYKQGSNILDLGCGPGDYENYIKSPVMADYSMEVLKKIPCYFKKKVVCADIKNLPFKKNSFDGLICIGLLQCHRLTLNDIEKISTTLKKGAWFVFETLNCRWHGLKSQLPFAKNKELEQFIKDKGIEKSYFTSDPFVLYKAETLVKWFELYNLKMHMLKYIYDFQGKASLFADMLNKTKNINHKAKSMSKFFIIAGFKN